MLLEGCDILKAGLWTGYAHPRVRTPLTLLLHRIKAGGIDQISRREGKTGDVDRRGSAQTPAITAIGGEPDLLGVGIAGMWSIPMAIRAAPQTTA